MKVDSIILMAHEVSMRKVEVLLRATPIPRYIYMNYAHYDLEARISFKDYSDISLYLVESFLLG